jgi:hypothetical protein
LVQENAVHPVPGEVARQGFDAAFHAVDVDVVAEARLGVEAFRARLARVDFPRVEVEQGRLAVVRLTLSIIQRDSA